MLSPDESGVIERFGRKLLPYREPGLHYKLPWPVDRLTRIKARRVRVVEIGFRTVASDAGKRARGVRVERAAPHRPLSEDAGRIRDADRRSEHDRTLRHGALRSRASGRFPVSPVGWRRHGARRGGIGDASGGDLVVARRCAHRGPARSSSSARGTNCRRRLDRYGAGVQVLEVKLEDVHPALEVVDAFREVSDAFEEKNRLINEAEGYRNEQLALAQGNAKAAAGKCARATAWDARPAPKATPAASFPRKRLFARRPEATQSRLYLETMEEVLPGKKKLIIDTRAGRRQLMLLARRNRLAQRAAPSAGVVDEAYAPPWRTASNESSR